MGIERVSHYIDNVLTEAQARMGLRDTRLLVTWYTNRENKQSVVHSHPYHELVLPIGGSTVRYSVDGSVYLVHVGELVYFPSQVYHSGNFNIDDDQSDRLVVQIDDALWQATRRRVNLKNTGWLQQLTVLDSEACRKWDFAGLFVRMGQSLELPGSIRDTVFEAQVAEMMLLITQATGSGQTAAPSSTSVLVARGGLPSDPLSGPDPYHRAAGARALRQPGAPFPCVQGVHHGEYPQLPDLSADAALPQGAGRGRFRPECLHRKRLSGLQQLPENLPPSVQHHPRRIPRTAPDNGALKAAAGEYENFSQKGLTFYPLCGIILEQSARAAEKQKK